MKWTCDMCEETKNAHRSFNFTGGIPRGTPKNVQRNIVKRVFEVTGV